MSGSARRRGSFAQEWEERLKVVYLHIGMHKTATTSIQVCLRKNQFALADIGYSIPSAGTSGTTHNNIAFSIRQLARFDPAKGGIDDLVDELSASTFERFIVSAEALDHLSKPEIEMLRRKLASCDIKIIVYLRHQVEWLQSEWSEMVKLRFYQHDFTTWVEQRAASDRRLHYFEFLERWAEVFGRENIRVRVFEKSRFRDRNVFDDFLQCCDIEEGHSWDLADRQNVSPGIKTIEVIRRYVRHCSGTLPENKLLGRCKRIVEFAERQGWNEEPLNLIDRTLYASIDKTFSATNDAVATTYLGSDRLFRDGFQDRPVTDFDIEGLDIDELFRLVAFLES
jgi:hypothetical protein